MAFISSPHSLKPMEVPLYWCSKHKTNLSATQSASLSMRAHRHGFIRARFLHKEGHNCERNRWFEQQEELCDYVWANSRNNHGGSRSLSATWIILNYLKIQVKSHCGQLLEFRKYTSIALKSNVPPVWLAVALYRGCHVMCDVHGCCC